VRYSKYAESLGVWGLYTGGNTVYLVPEMEVKTRKSQAYLVLVHEMVHYIETILNNSPNSQVAVCLSEEEAFEVDGALAVELGMPELDRSETWVEHYPGCRPGWGWAPEDDGEAE
jgi:hypothetical protein